MDPTIASNYWNPLVPELSVSNLETSLRFYLALGFSIRFRRDEPAFVYLELGQAQIMLEQIHDKAWITDDIQKPFGRGINLQIEVEDVRLTAQKVTDCGMPLFRPISESWYAVDQNQKEGQIEFLVQDPDGYLLRFVQPIGVRSTDA